MLGLVWVVLWHGMLRHGTAWLELADDGVELERGRARGREMERERRRARLTIHIQKGLRLAREEARWRLDHAASTVEVGARLLPPGDAAPGH